jgi:hypothetical protein
MLAAASVLALAVPAAAQEYEQAMRNYLESKIMSWANDPALIAAVRAQNARTASLSQSEVDTLDQAWRAEVGTSSTPTITPVLDNATADFLRKRVEEGEGTLTEAFVMDARGLNVAVSSVTSDYWQGDEDKYSMTYPKGPGAVHFSDVEFDESSQTYQAQISIPLVDTATNEVVGALTVGVNAEALF